MQQGIALIFMILFFVVFYMIIFIPENKRKKKYNAMLKGIKVNDEILTKGGIVGKVINVEEDYLIMQTGPDKIRIKVVKNGVSSLINKKEEVKEVKETKEAKEKDKKEYKEN